MNATIATNHNFLINGKSVITGTLELEREQVDVTTSTEPDPNWTFVDAAGHIHAYGKDFSLPTLKPVSRFVPCECCDEEDDEQGGYSLTDYHCLICDETVVPGSRATVGQKFMPGRYSWRVDFTAGVEWVLNLDRQKVSVWMTDGGRLKTFGVGVLSVRSVSPQGIAAGQVFGAGELGQR